MVDQALVRDLTFDSVHAELQAKEEAAAAESEEKEQLRLKKMCKDPTARTDFLPDKEREAEEEAVRAQLRKEYELRQKVPLFPASRQFRVPKAFELMRTQSQHILVPACIRSRSSSHEGPGDGSQSIAPKLQSTQSQKQSSTIECA